MLLNAQMDVILESEELEEDAIYAGFQAKKVVQ